MLTDWLAPVSLDEVRARSLRTAPEAHPGTAFGACPLLDWEVLDHVLRTADDVLVRTAALARDPHRPVPTATAR